MSRLLESDRLSWVCVADNAEKVAPVVGDLMTRLAETGGSQETRRFAKKAVYGLERVVCGSFRSHIVLNHGLTLRAAVNRETLR